MVDDSQTASRRRPPSRPAAGAGSAKRRPPQRSWLARNGLLIAVVSLGLGAVLVLVALRGDSGGGSGGLTGADFHSIVVDPDNPDRLFVGGHTAVSVSVDGGATWSEVGSLRDADAMGWSFTTDAVYVSGHPGLNRSTDGGGSFERINEGLPNTDVHAFGGTDSVLYGASPAVGVFASTGDAGVWEVRTSTAGQSFFGRIVIDPADDGHLFAADASSGVAESIDGGRSWELVDSGPPAATWLSRGGDGLELLVASGPAGAARSSDGGTTWEPVDLPAGATLVEAVPGDPDLLYAGSHSGTAVAVQVSTDGGRSWTRPSG